MLQLQRHEHSSGTLEHAELLRLEADLSTLLTKYLVMFTEQSIYMSSLEQFGELIYEQESSVLTFNYDLILERAIEYASGSTGNSSINPLYKAHETVPDSVLPQHKWNWIRALAYGIEFDEVELQRAKERPGLVPGACFYSHPDNTPRIPTLLKLHGSLNWFTQTSVKADGSVSASTNPQAERSVLLDEYPNLGYGMDAPEVNGWLLRPEIITPMIHKNISSGLFADIWRKAEDELKACRRLVVGGYSFPPSDFHTRKLLLEAFENHRPEELVVINPDTSVVETAKTLCHFDRPVTVCADLPEYMAS